MVVAVIALAAEQAWSLTGNYALPSIRNRANPLPAEVKAVGASMKSLLPRGTVVGVVGVDPRIPLALQEADVRIPPVFLTLPSTYRKLNEGLTPEQQATTIAELADLSGWTDAIAKQWIENDFDWLVLQRQPAPPNLPWLTWAPNAPLITTALEKCFEQNASPSFGSFDPPLVVDLYKRVRRGKVCLGE